jgi:hypothetical protein
MEATKRKSLTVAIEPGTANYCKARSYAYRWFGHLNFESCNEWQAELAVMLQWRQFDMVKQKTYHFKNKEG